ncbi:hypothetical protein BTO20_36530 (plasmid) [Mycobacterium dioxanotrophicus]|uniref:Uncharacterized protein n=1 Tax=Mycobacterium dioxanotrophicus TaxID=482462 RepID=A0A1Y0CFX2_9MYCO|nr:hypothetical protein [Mycobacterium dioxanotrophicus]ART74171.1 hypothetical protein BTO20_36530 [Mycobacterium dioxanotrophicus]
MASTDENDSLRRLFEADQYPAGKDHPSEPPNAPDTEQLPDQVIADRWENAAAALETARNAWLAVSPDSAGPITELLHSARWNATVYRHIATGFARTDAWRLADAQHQRPQSRHIVYDPNTDTDTDED